jgi:hypothetical protein
LLEIDDANLILPPIRGVKLMQLGNESDPFNPRQVWDGLHHGLGAEVDDIQQPRRQMSSEEVVAVTVDRQVIEPASWRPWQIDGGDTYEGRPTGVSVRRDR